MNTASTLSFTVSVARRMQTNLVTQYINNLLLLEIKSTNQDDFYFLYASLNFASLEHLQPLLRNHLKTLLGNHLKPLLGNHLKPLLGNHV